MLCVKVIMFKAYKFRIYPTTEQQIALAKSFGCCRWYWNYALNLCQQTYTETGKGLSRNVIQGLLPSLKKEHPWLKDAYSQCLQYVALNLSTAYKNFFEKRAKSPRFKSKKGRQSISFPQNTKFKGDLLKLPKIGWVYCRRHRGFEGTVKTVTISLNPDGKYYVSALVDDGVERATPSTKGKAIGIDLGLTHFAITSEGSKYDNPRHIAKHAANLKRKQQKLARSSDGSNTRKKTKRLVAKVQSKIARCREDFLHKLSRKIVNDNQVIVVENLAVKNMVKNHNLAKAISDCGWGMFCTMLGYKAEAEGKVYLEVDRFFPSSRISHLTGYRFEDLKLLDRRLYDPIAEKWLDRDINAAINIKNEGLRILSLGTSDTAIRRESKTGGKTSVLSSAFSLDDGSPVSYEAG